MMEHISLILWCIKNICIIFWGLFHLRCDSCECFLSFIYIRFLLVSRSSGVLNYGGGLRLIDLLSRVITCFIYYFISFITQLMPTLFSKFGNSVELGCLTSHYR